MEVTAWPPEYEEVLRQHLPLLGDEPLYPTTQLADAGLDSLGSVALLLELEETLMTVVPDDRLGPDTFSTAGGLWEMIAALPRDDRDD